METLKINVTQKDINDGCQGSLYLCPIAKAVRRSGKQRISVCDTLLEIREKVYKLPRIATKFVHAFDIGKPVKPFSFIAKRF